MQHYNFRLLLQQASNQPDRRPLSAKDFFNQTEDFFLLYYGSYRTLFRTLNETRSFHTKRDRLAALDTRIEAGPRPEDGSCRLAGREIQRILAQEFGAVYSLAGTYRLLHRMGYSSLI
jgi:hypothetical protein